MIDQIVLAPQLGLSQVDIRRLGSTVLIAGPNGAGKTRLLKLVREQISKISSVASSRRPKPQNVWSYIKLPEEVKNVVSVCFPEVHLALVENPLSDNLDFRNTLLAKRRQQNLVLANNNINCLLTFDEQTTGFHIDAIKSPEPAIRVIVGTAPTRLSEEAQSIWQARLCAAATAKMKELLHKDKWPRVTDDDDPRPVRQGVYSVIFDFFDKFEAFVRVELEQLSSTIWFYHDSPVSKSSGEICITKINHEILEKAAFALYMSSHADWAAQNTEAIDWASKLRDRIKQFLGRPLTWRPPTIDSRSVGAAFGDREINESELSAGERIILSWLTQSELQHPMAIFIDEPELHLHPGAMIEMISSLRKQTDAQIWIATHSVSLLAAMVDASVIYVDKGAATWAGNRAQALQSSLLGGDEGVACLRTFMADTASIAFHQFATQCLLPPGVIGASAGDPQTAQFVTHVQRKLSATRDVVRILDYAAGRGRLIEAFAGQQISMNLEIFAYCDLRHTDDSDASRCRAEVENLCVGGVRSHFITDLRCLQKDRCMDAVVLCNTLHEISVDAWIRTFREIAHCLHGDGALLILEDQRMAVGELPHANGFLVLDEFELWELFVVGSDERSQVKWTVEYDGRLSLFEVPLRFLDRVSVRSTVAALTALQKRAQTEIQSIRSTKNELTHRDGRLHAYYTMLYANASLALTQLGVLGE
jgi:energy-coupling factor transporter ATP-binding protein EcfA2